MVTTLEELQDYCCSEEMAQQAYGLVLLEFSDLAYAELFEGGEAPEVLRSRLWEAAQQGGASKVAGDGADRLAALCLAEGSASVAKFANHFRDELSRALGGAPGVRISVGVASAVKLGDSEVWGRAEVALESALKNPQSMRTTVVNPFSRGICTSAFVGGPRKRPPDEGGPGVLSRLTPPDPDLSAGAARRLGD